MSYEEITKELAKAEETWDALYEEHWNKEFPTMKARLKDRNRLFESKEYKKYEHFMELELLNRPMTNIVLTESDKCGDRFTLKGFVKFCKQYVFIDDDGFGVYGYSDKKSDLSAIPSMITKGIIRTDFTHVYWYNK